MEDDARGDRLSLLGDSKAGFTGLETFAKPANVNCVSMASDEVTALCPVTGQPDWYRVEIEYEPLERCIESKSLKLYLHSFRECGLFVEQLASVIVESVMSAARPGRCTVTVHQKARGGISIVATAEIRT